MPKGAIQRRNQPTLKENLTGKLAMGPPVAVPERNVHVDDHYRRSPNWEGPAFGPQPAPEPGFEAAPAGPSSPYGFTERRLARRWTPSASTLLMEIASCKLLTLSTHSSVFLNTTLVLSSGF